MTLNRFKDHAFVGTHGLKEVIVKLIRLMSVGLTGYRIILLECFDLLCRDIESLNALTGQVD